MREAAKEGQIGNTVLGRQMENAPPIWMPPLQPCKDQTSRMTLSF